MGIGVRTIELPSRGPNRRSRSGSFNGLQNLVGAGRQHTGAPTEELRGPRLLGADGCVVEGTQDGGHEAGAGRLARQEERAGGEDAATQERQPCERPLPQRVRRIRQNRPCLLAGLEKTPDCPLARGHRLKHGVLATCGCLAAPAQVDDQGAEAGFGRERLQQAPPGVIAGHPGEQVLDGQFGRLRLPRVDSRRTDETEIDRRAVGHAVADADPLETPPDLDGVVKPEVGVQAIQDARILDHSQLGVVERGHEKRPEVAERAGAGGLRGCLIVPAPDGEECHNRLTAPRLIRDPACHEHDRLDGIGKRDECRCQVGPSVMTRTGQLGVRCVSR